MWHNKLTDGLTCALGSNYDCAAYFYMQAPENPKALSKLADILYYQQTTVKNERDIEDALDLYYLSADELYSFYSYAYMMAYGEGTSKNLTKSIEILTTLTDLLEKTEEY